MPGDSVQPFPYWLATFDGTRLRKRRRDHELSQERLSHRAHVSLKTIQRVEKLPAATCHFGTLQRLARALSHDPDAFITELTAGAGDTQAAPARPARPPRPRPDPWWRKARPFPSAKAGHGRYNAAMARELLAMTSEFPDTQGRHADPADGVPTCAL